MFFFTEPFREGAPANIIMLDDRSDSEDDLASLEVPQSSDEEQLATPLPDSEDEEGEEEQEKEEDDFELMAGEQLSVSDDNDTSKSLIDYQQHLMKPDGRRKDYYYL